MQNQANLVNVDHGFEITRTSAPQFWHICQQGLLLALKDEGILGEVQLQYAQKKLADRQKGGVR